VVDAFAINAYLTWAMLRQLLTLLAILSGLAAAGAPAQARISGFDGVQLEAARERVPACEALQQSRSAMPLEAHARSAVGGLSCPRPIVTIVIPTVQLGVDRARE